MHDLLSLGPFDRPPTIIDLLEERIGGGDGDRLWLQDVGGGSATYAEALHAARRWAGALRSIGVDHQTVVSTMNPNSVATTLLWLGIVSLRAWEAPVHPSYQGYMLEHAVNSARAETLFVDVSFVDRVAASAANLQTLKRVVVMGGTSDASLPFEVVTADELLASATPATDLERPEPWDLASIIYTSGTTGPSKGVMVPWGDIAAFVARIWPIEDLGPDDAIYGFTPSSHIGAKNLPYLAALIGGRFVLRPDFKLDRFLPDIREYGITTTAVVGAIARFLEQMPAQPDDHEIPLRNLTMAPAVPDLDAFKERFGIRVATCYSMTELSGPIASEGWNVSNWQASGKLSPGWPYFEIRVVDENDYDVGPNTVGELIVRAAAPWTLNLGYFGMPEATAHAWRNGWFHTGDGFTYDENGYFYFVDRLKDTIRRRGENVSSFEVEAMVNQFENVLESAAVAVPSEFTEDEIKVYVVPAPGASLDPSALCTFLIDRMPRFMVPRYIEVVDELPKTMGTMRTQKSKLREDGVSDTTWDREAAGVKLPR